MKRLSQIFVSLTLLAAFAVMGPVGCKPKGCIDPEADNYDPAAKVDDGTCIPARDKFIGTYNSAENCPSGNFNYQMTITNSSTAPNAILIGNFGDFNVTANATVSKNTLTIPSQTFNIQGISLTVNGTGVLNGAILSINYTASALGGAETCAINCTKL